MQHRFSGPAPTNHRQVADFYALSSTLDKYEVEEISVGFANKLLETSEHRRLKLVHVATDVEAEHKKAAIGLANWNRIVCCGYEVEEIATEVLAF